MKQEVNSNSSEYRMFREIINGKGHWYVMFNGTEEYVPITYDQARGYEPITRQEMMKRKLGKMLLSRK